MSTCFIVLAANDSEVLERSEVHVVCSFYEEGLADDHLSTNLATKLETIPTGIAHIVLGEVVNIIGTINASGTNAQQVQAHLDSNIGIQSEVVA